MSNRGKSKMIKNVFENKYKVSFKDYTFIIVSLNYYRDTKTFVANLTPGKYSPHSNLITLTYPQDGKRFIISQVKRFSKKAEEQAIEMVENNIAYMLNEVKKKI